MSGIAAARWCHRSRDAGRSVSLEDRGPHLPATKLDNYKHDVTKLFVALVIVIEFLLYLVCSRCIAIQLVEEMLPHAWQSSTMFKYLLGKGPSIFSFELELYLPGLTVIFL